jgi:hypothetical protein
MLFHVTLQSKRRDRPGEKPGGPKMSFDQVGADLGQLATLRRLFERDAGELERLVHEISAAVGPAGGQGSVRWDGRVADRFRQDWNQTFAPGLRRLTEALRESAVYVERNRQNISQALNGSAV